MYLTLNPLIHLQGEALAVYRACPFLALSLNHLQPRWRMLMQFEFPFGQPKKCGGARWTIITVVIIVLLLLAGHALAAPPENADPELAPWFQSNVNSKGMSCCGLGDGHRVQYKIVGGDHEYEFNWNGQWIPVPNEIVLHRHDNPTGDFIIYFTEVSGGLIMYCAIPPVES